MRSLSLRNNIYMQNEIKTKRLLTHCFSSYSLYPGALSVPAPGLGRGDGVALDPSPAPLLQIGDPSADAAELLIAALPWRSGLVRALLGQHLHVVEHNLPTTRHGRDHVTL